MRLRFYPAAVAAVVLASCSGGGMSGGSSLPHAGLVNGGTPPATSANVRMSLLIPNPLPVSARVRRAFVSPSTQGVAITIYAHSDTTHSSPLVTTAVNVSSESNLCTNGSSGRTCSIALSSPAGTNDFVFALYDAAPSGGVFPSSAHELGIADVTQTINANAQNTVTVPVSAIIAGLSGTPQTVLELSNGSAHTVGLVIAPTDFDDQTITAGGSNAPFANPIAVSVSESGGSGHTLVSLDGGTPAASVTMAKATDTVSAIYDGKGAGGYSATVAASAPAYNHSGGATQESVQINTFGVSNPTVFYSLGPPTLKTYPAGEHLLSIAENGVASTTTYTVTPTGCSGILTTGTIVGKGTNASLIVIGGTTTSTGGCSLAFSDGTNTFNVAVTNQLRSGPGSSPTITEYPTSANGPFGITTGPDGNLWFTELNATAVDKISTNGSGFVGNSVLAQGFSEPFGISVGPDGNLWFGDDNSALIGSMTTSANLTVYSQQSQPDSDDPIAGLDGDVWFGESGGANMGAIVPGNQTPAEFPIASGSGPIGNAVGSNTQVWFGLLATGADGPLGEIETLGSGRGTIAQFSAATSAGPFSFALGSDGAIWFTEMGSDIGRIDTSGNITEYLVPGTPSLNFITAGPDGALWFADNGNVAIGRITTSGTIKEYPVTTASAEPVGITVGPDGNIWFTDYGNNSIGTLIL